MNALVVLDNLSQIRSRIAAAAGRAGRSPEAVTIVAVTKYAPVDEVRTVVESGQISEIGESRVQDAARKFAALGAAAGRARKRLIGHLQTNKVKQALSLFDCVDSLDSARLAEAIEKELARGELRLGVLAQVKLTDREAQSGVTPEELPGFLKSLEGFPHLEVKGLLAIAPDVEPVEKTRPSFRRMKRLFDDFFGARAGAQLSMGMSRDFEIAVEEGATHVRIGSSIFSRTTEVMQQGRIIHDR